MVVAVRAGGEVVAGTERDVVVGGIAGDPVGAGAGPGVLEVEGELAGTGERLVMPVAMSQT